MENRITKILDKMEKSYKIDEEGCIVVEFTSIRKVLGVCIKLVEFMQIKIIDEKLELVRILESVEDPESNSVIQRQFKYATIDSVILMLLDNCIEELDNE